MATNVTNHVLVKNVYTDLEIPATGERFVVMNVGTPEVIIVAESTGAIPESTIPGIPLTQGSSITLAGDTGKVFARCISSTEKGSVNIWRSL